MKFRRWSGVVDVNAVFIRLFLMPEPSRLRRRCRHFPLRLLPCRFSSRTPGRTSRRDSEAFRSSGRTSDRQSPSSAAPVSAQPCRSLRRRPHCPEFHFRSICNTLPYAPPFGSPALIVRSRQLSFILFPFQSMSSVRAPHQRDPVDFARDPAEGADCIFGVSVGGKEETVKFDL